MIFLLHYEQARKIYHSVDLLLTKFPCYTFHPFLHQYIFSLFPFSIKYIASILSASLLFSMDCVSYNCGSSKLPNLLKHYQVFQSILSLQLYLSLIKLNKVLIFPVKFLQLQFHLALLLQ